MVGCGTKLHGKVMRAYHYRPGGMDPGASFHKDRGKWCDRGMVRGLQLSRHHPLSPVMAPFFFSPTQLHILPAIRPNFPRYSAEATCDESLCVRWNEGASGGHMQTPHTIPTISWAVSPVVAAHHARSPNPHSDGRCNGCCERAPSCRNPLPCHRTGIGYHTRRRD